MPQHIVIALSVLLLNIVIFRPAHYALTIAPAFIVWFLMTFYYPLSLEKRKAWVVAGILLALPLINGFQVLSGQAEPGEFVRTYAKWCFLIIGIVIASTAKIKVQNSATEKAAGIALVVLTFIMTMQITFAYAFKDTSLFSMLDEVLFGGPIDLSRFAVLGRIRPLGLYFEPSFAALVMLTLLTILLLRDKLFTPVGLVGAAGVVITTSFSGYIGLAVLLLGVLYGKTSGALGPSAYPPRRPLIWVAALAGFVFFYNSCQSDAVSPVTRSHEVTQTINTGHQTSTYERVVQPVAILREAVLDHPSGIAFGRFPAPEFQPFYYRLADGVTRWCTLNNGFYLLVFYFGWIGILGIVCGLSWLLVRVIRNKEFNLLILLLYTLLSFGITGMILRPEYFALLLMVIFQCRISSCLHRDRETLAGTGAETT